MKIDNLGFPRLVGLLAACGMVWTAMGPARAQMSSAVAAVNEDLGLNPPPTVFDNSATDYGSLRLNELLNSFTGAEGILQVQQNNGNNNAIDVAAAVVVVTSPTTVMTGASVRGFSDNNFAEHFGLFAIDPDRDNLITSSFNGFEGIATIQQNNGDNNSIGAATAVLASLESAAPITQSAAVDSRVLSGSDAIGFDDGSLRENTITYSFTGALGVVTVQQNNGSGNVVGSAFSVSADTSADSLTQDAESLAIGDFELANIQITDFDSIRHNLINNAFVDVEGVFTIQQNNGDGNALSAGTAVAASMHGGIGGGPAAQNVTAAGSVFFGFSLQDAFFGDGERDNSILYSFIPDDSGTAKGVVTVQQNNGSGNAISEATGVHANVDAGLAPDSEVIAAAQQDSSVSDQFGRDLNDLVDRANTIRLDSFDGFEGIVTVQQNNGDNNSLSAATGVQASVAASGSDAGLDSRSTAAVSFPAADPSNDFGSIRENTLLSTFDGFKGIATIQQNNGDGNAISSATAVAAYVDGGNVAQSADSPLADVSAAAQVDESLSRLNEIDNAFTGFEGVLTAQQNNGTNNAMSSATSVMAGTGGVTTQDLTQAANATGSTGFTESVDTDGIDFSDFSVIGERFNTVDGSFNGDTHGIVTVQQNEGDANGISNATSVQAELKSHDVTAFDVSATAESFANLADQNNLAGGSLDEADRGNLVTGSFTDFEGVATVQQNNGDGNGMAAATGVTAQAYPGGSIAGQTVTADSGLNGVSLNGDLPPISDTNAHRDNTVVYAFDGAEGIVTLQQNNGNANGLAAATGVAANVLPFDLSQSAATDGTSSFNIVDDLSLLRSNSIHDTFYGFEGVATIQQNNGDANFLGAATAVAANEGPGGAGASESGAAATTLADGNDVIDGDFLESGPPDVVIGKRENTIANAFNGPVKGIVTGQQNNGSGNALGASTAVQASLGGTPSSQTALIDVSSTSTNNSGDHTGGGSLDVPDRENTLTGSFTAYAGIATLQQNNGDNNAIGAATAVVAALYPSGDLSAEVLVEGESSGQIGFGPGGALVDFDSNRLNTITGMFDYAEGVASVQQNNGDGNALSTGTAVGANTGTGTVDFSASVVGTVTGNTISDESLLRFNTVDTTFAAFKGILSVQQNNGNGNVLGIGNAALANFYPADGPHGAQGSATATVEDSFVEIVTASIHENEVVSSLNGAIGVVTVQQNNGNDNVLNAVNSVTANLAAGLGGAVSTATLDATVAFTETAVAYLSEHRNHVSDSLKASAGLGTIQQNNGNHSAVQSSIVGTANF